MHNVIFSWFVNRIIGLKLIKIFTVAVVVKWWCTPAWCVDGQVQSSTVRLQAVSRWVATLSHLGCRPITGRAHLTPPVSTNERPGPPEPANHSAEPGEINQSETSIVDQLDESSHKVLVTFWTILVIRRCIMSRTQTRHKNKIQFLRVTEMHEMRISSWRKISSVTTKYIFKRKVHALFSLPAKIFTVFASLSRI